MANSKKTNGKLDVHVRFEPPISNELRNDASKQQSTLAQFIRSIVINAYEARKAEVRQKPKNIVDDHV